MSTAETRVSVEIAGSEISFETGKMAKQASGAVVVRQGDTVVLSTATAGNLRDVDFLPLTVDVEERMYAAGKIPGSFFKREGRSGEKGTLVARMIDRPLRPLFPKGWRHETQLVSMTLSIDDVHPYDILAMNGASAALMISDIPYPSPVGAVRIGKVDGNFVVNPNEQDTFENSDLDLDRGRHRRGHPDGRGRRQRDPRGRDPRRARHRPRRDQEAVRAAARAAREGRQGRRWRSRSRRSTRASTPQIAGVARRRPRRGHADLRQARAPERVRARHETRPSRQHSGDPEADAEYGDRKAAAQMAVDKLEKQIIRQRIAIHKKRPDGRGEDEIRPISIEAGLLPRTHGSALFTRGQTQALSRRRARHAQGGDAPRHARPRDEEVLLPPLQLPAVLGRGGGLHARPQAPRHRPRRARRAGAGADGAVDRGRSRTRFASCRTSSSPTARRRWRRSADRRCR